MKTYTVKSEIALPNCVRYVAWNSGYVIAVQMGVREMKIHAGLNLSESYRRLAMMNPWV
jgi:hypothetical protein